MKAMIQVFEKIFPPFSCDTSSDKERDVLFTNWESHSSIAKSDTFKM